VATECPLFSQNALFTKSDQDTVQCDELTSFLQDDHCTYLYFMQNLQVMKKEKKELSTEGNNNTKSMTRLSV
jgi:hypothetical protein